VDSDSDLTILYIAAGNAGLKLVTYLVEQKTEINVKDRRGYTPLDRAAESGDLEVVQWLYDKTPIENPVSLIHASVGHSRLNILK